MGASVNARTVKFRKRAHAVPFCLHRMHWSRYMDAGEILLHENCGYISIKTYGFALRLSFHAEFDR